MDKLDKILIPLNIKFKDLMTCASWLGAGRAMQLSYAALGAELLGEREQLVMVAQSILEEMDDVATAQ